MALPEFTLRQLLEAGVHFGHQTHRWNPRMDRYIYGARNGIHIMDLTQTVPLLDQALAAVQAVAAKGGRILFVGTKRQAQKAILDAAERSAQYYMNHRWLGGTLTNWQTVSKSITRLKQYDERLESGSEGLTKKELLKITREQTKLQASLGGIREMGGTPDILFVIDTNKEALAIAEARKLGIPVIAVLDTNSDPVGIDYPIPGNDDAARSIALYCDLIARAALDGMAAQLGASGVDVGAMEEAPVEEAVAEEVVAEELAKEPAKESVAETPAVEEPKVEEAPAAEAPVKEAPAKAEKAKPAKKAVAKKAPAKKAPAKKAPAEKAETKAKAPAKAKKKAPAKKAKE
ncbi:MAG: 30S ribosomal protein S2 [Paracoccaceae bacterium]